MTQKLKVCRHAKKPLTNTELNWDFFVQNIYSLPLSSNGIPNDCLTLLEYYYPFTLSSFYEEYKSNKTNELYSVVYELRDSLLNNSNHQFLSSLQFNIKPERLKLFHDPSPTVFEKINIR